MNRREWYAEQKAAILAGLGNEQQKQAAIRAAQDVARTPVAMGLHPFFAVWVRDCGWLREAVTPDAYLPWSVKHTKQEVVVMLKEKGRPYGKEAIAAELAYQEAGGEIRRARATAWLLAGLTEGEAVSCCCSQEEWQIAKNYAREGGWKDAE